MTSSSALSISDRKLLLVALEAGRSFEANFDSENETRFRSALAACANGESTLIVKLGELAPKVSLALGPKHLMALLVPLERLSGRAARDEEFLFEERDGSRANAPITSPSPEISPRLVLCENIRSAFNVGAIFRTAEAFSAAEIFLCGYTPDPQKTAMGADALVPSRRFDRAADAIQQAKADGFKIVALENSPGSIALEDFVWPEKTLLVLGNERFGVDSETLASSDHVVRISATGQKNSINVGIAFGVAASRWHLEPTANARASAEGVELQAPLSSRKISPIGFLRGGFANSQVAPRQGAYRVNDGMLAPSRTDSASVTSLKTSMVTSPATPPPTSSARIELEARFEGRPSNFEQALKDLDGFERAWVVFGFHESQGWNPQVRPPRGDGSKRGLFATRSPHRPNGLGISCVRVLKVDALKRVVEITEHDLLEGTPIFDLKPYVPGADAFAHANAGWVDAIEASAYNISESTEAKKSLNWLEANGETRLRPFVDEQLRYQPLDSERKRVSRVDLGETNTGTHAVGLESSRNSYTIAFRTWRIDFAINEKNQTLELLRIRSGYLENEIAAGDDTYGDKDLHRAYTKRSE